MKARNKNITGYIAVTISALFANLWAYWGIIENFHEGWYHPDLSDRILMMFGQYLAVPLVFIVLGLISFNWPKIGALLHVVLAVFAYFIFGRVTAGLFFISIPVLGLSLLYWVSCFPRKIYAYITILILPMILMIGIGIYQFHRVSLRYNNHKPEAMLIQGNGVRLVWAPDGPGWPDKGTTWDEACRICRHLDTNGKIILTREVGIWRLPTVDEAVRSQVYHGQNSGGVWDRTKNEASYQLPPDKESPLWNPNVKTIYWWTSTEVNNKQAYIIVFNGGVFPRDKKIRAGYLNFRAVKNIN
jgi:hypothetical protein